MRSFVRAAAIFTFTLGLAADGFAAQPRNRAPPNYVQPGAPDQAEGGRILEQSREITLAGAYYLEFELRVLPRAGDERRLAGRWFGSRNATGPVARIELSPALNTTEIWLVQSGPKPAVWRAQPGAAFAPVERDAAMEPIAGTQLSAADLQTPFMYWRDFVYEGATRFRGRRTYVFLLYPPEAEREQFPGVGGARVFVDVDYRALLQAQWVDAAGEALKTITILDLKKIGDQWIVKSFEARDERTRDKTRFVVTAAALDLPVPDELFTPAGDAAPANVAIPAGRLVAVP